VPTEDCRREGRGAQLFDLRREGGDGEDHHAVRAHWSPAEMTTNLEGAWMDAICQIGCIVCFLFEDAPNTPGCPHHLLTNGGRRRGDLDTICLCDPGHHQNSPTAKKISRHPNKARFEEAYGTEEQLLARSRKMVEQLFGLYVGVDIDAVHRSG
jgi:hypothetical protein